MSHGSENSDKSETQSEHVSSQQPNKAPVSTPQLVDRIALASRRARAALAPQRFLHEEAIREVHERLSDVNRTFTAPVIVGPEAGFWAESLDLDAQQISDTDTLDLQECAHDLALHALCLHNANDPVGQLVQMRRALKPDGLMIACLFGGRSLSELRAAFAEAESQLRGGLSPRVVPMADLRDLGGLLQRAGLALPVADSFTLKVSYSDLHSLMQDLRGMGEANSLAARERRFLRRDVLKETARVYRENFSAEGGRIFASAEFVFLTGWAQADIQQKPLRPGSARTRLSDALGVDEIRAGDPVIKP